LSALVAGWPRPGLRVRRGVARLRPHRGRLPPRRRAACRGVGAAARAGRTTSVRSHSPAPLTGCDGLRFWGTAAQRYSARLVKSTVEPLEGNKVKCSDEVDEDEFDKAIDDAFRKIAREVRLPGFRPGKAPRKVLEARLGRGVGRAQALQDALPDF